MKGCQVAILILMAVGLLRGLWQDFNGVKGRGPYGFTGAVISIVVTAIMFWVYRTAGAFSELW